MENNKINDAMDQFLSPKQTKKVSNDGMEREECDLQTGECYVITSKDGIVKTFVGGGERELVHPSHQAYTYAKLIQEYNEVVQNEIL